MTINKVIAYWSNLKYGGMAYCGLCRQCKKLFYCYYANFGQAFCSRNCATQAFKKCKGKDIICKTCKTIFHCGKSITQTFCSKKCAGLGLRGKNSPHWKGGYWIDGHGYKRICIGNGKYIYEHRIIAQKFFGNLPNGCIIHHKNGNKLDNSPENLEIMTRADHVAHHAPRLGTGGETMSAPHPI